jgi:hypothetical protein
MTLEQPLFYLFPKKALNLFWIPNLRDMKKIYLTAAFLLFLGSWCVAAPPSLWEVFGRVKFVEKFNKKIQANLYYPEFTPEINDLKGKQVTLEGYVIPLETATDFVVLSRYPYSQCFFCGGAGPESVAAVFFKKKPNLKLDQYITVSGTLELNGHDIEMFNFILRNAEVKSSK